MNRSKHKDKKKVKISERLNLKKSYTKLTPNKSGGENNPRECLNIFEEDDFEEHRGPETTGNDTSMDLRGSFEEL